MCLFSVLFYCLPEWKNALSFTGVGIGLKYEIGLGLT